MNDSKRILIPRFSWWVGDERIFVVLGLYFRKGEPFQYEILEAGKNEPILRAYMELQELVADGALRRWD